MVLTNQSRRIWSAPADSAENITLALDISFYITDPFLPSLCLTPEISELNANGKARS